MQFLDTSHYGVDLSSRESLLIRLWIDSGVTYPGTYAALGSGMFPVAYPHGTFRRRCAECHTARQPTYRNLKKDAFYYRFGQRQPPQPLLDDLDDIILIRHRAYNQFGESRSW